MPDFYLQPPKPDNNNKKIVWLIILGIIVLILLFAYNAKNKSITTLLPEEFPEAKIGQKFMLLEDEKGNKVLSFYEEKHKCNWVDCSHFGEIMDQHNFISRWGYEPDTDGYYTELTHFMNPDWTYEQCEEYVFTGVE